jgi:hypothetical protein
LFIVISTSRRPFGGLLSFADGSLLPEFRGPSATPREKSTMQFGPEAATGLSPTMPAHTLPLEASWTGSRTAVACLSGTTAEAGLPVIRVETRKPIAIRKGQIGGLFVVSRQLQPSLRHAMQRVTVCCNVTTLRQPPALFGISPKFLLVGHAIGSLLLTSRSPRKCSTRRRV